LTTASRSRATRRALYPFAALSRMASAISCTPSKILNSNWPSACHSRSCFVMPRVASTQWITPLNLHSGTVHPVRIPAGPRHLQVLHCESSHSSYLARAHNLQIVDKEHRDLSAVNQFVHLTFVGLELLKSIRAEGKKRPRCVSRRAQREIQTFTTGCWSIMEFAPTPDTCP